ncbi:serine protease [Paraglaciecola aquimarina]|uniref:Serine protease n=1 Tax=Paraglaciecola algarum TaxID=3050085 RepID=A0ABS9D6Z8_9ALTE|nr:serine protease [Paraglaciecola sp. G1-23]MCF2948706.1 serine protease [Paraglaciecola sp. G1-23]
MRLGIVSFTLWFALNLALTFSFMSTAFAELSANDLIKQNEHKIVQVTIVNQVSGQKVSFGSGFYVNSQGLLVTNYHVISRVVGYPEDYVVQFIDSLDEQHKAKIVDLDVINDLALLQTELTDTEFFELADHLPKKGQALYSIGNPLDLGMIVVPGTFNGLINHRFTEEINLTGSINPGMSGGPTINSESKVVGINVTTRGNQIGSLVPVGKLHALIDTYKTTPVAPKYFSKKITQQLTDYQTALYEPILSSQWPVDTLGSATVPQKIAEFLSCGSGSNQSDEKRQYDRVSTGCQLRESISLNSSSRLSGFKYSSEWRKSQQLNQFQLANLYQRAIRHNPTKSTISTRDTTNYQCEQGVVENEQGSTMKTSTCIRAYRLYPGLFDVSFRALLLGKDDQAIIAKFSLNAVTPETGQAFTNKFVENIQWN